LVAVSPRGKGTKISALSEAHGLPIGVEVFPANMNDKILVEPVLAGATFGLPKPKNIIGDAQYNSQDLSKRLFKKYHIHFSAPRMRNATNKFQDGRRLRRNKRRWKIERSLSWLRARRRIECRWDRFAENFLSFVRIGCSRILISRLRI